MFLNCVAIVTACKIGLVTIWRVRKYQRKIKIARYREEPKEVG